MESTAAPRPPEVSHDGPEPSIAKALACAARDWPVVPLWRITPDGGCECGDSDCKHPGKHSRTEHAHLDATCDETVVRGWWTQWPDAGIGIDLERAGLVDVAPDSPAWLEMFHSSAYGLPRTPSFVSGGGAGHEHYLYRRPDSCPAGRICRPGQYDILSKGIAVLPPSPHASGTVRYWLVRPDEAPLAVVPLWAVDRLRQAEERREAARETARQAAIDAEGEPPVRLGGDALARWRGELVEQGPNNDVDRSDSLFEIGRCLARANATYRTIIEALRERDLTLGWAKYSSRQDADERYAEIATKVLANAFAPQGSPAIQNEGLGNDPTTWPQHVSAEGGPANGKCSDHCTRHLQREVELEREVRELREQNALRAALIRRPKEELKPADKLVGVAILNLQASLESRGETGRIPVVIEAEPNPEREQWTDTSLTAVVGMSDSTVRRSLERLAPTTGGGLWEREYEPYVTSEGLQRSRLVLKPTDNRPAAEQWKTILTFTPPDEDKPAPRRELIRCKRHPFVKVNKETTWRCTVCGRHAKEPRLETLDPCEVESPAIQNDRLVNGLANPGQAPGRDIWAVAPAIQNEGLGEPETLSTPVDVVKGRHSDGLVSESAAVRDAPAGSLHYWPVYDRAPIQPVVVDSPSAEAEDPPRGGHACQDCGAFGDEQWGDVVLIGPPGRQMWLHRGMDAPCHDRSARVGGAA